MAKIEKVTFDYKEIVTALVKKENIHEGIWMLYVEFGLVAINAPVAPEGEVTPPLEDQLHHLMPTAVLPIKSIGIQRAKELNNLSVDAAKVNPDITGGSKKKV